MKAYGTVQVLSQKWCVRRNAYVRSPGGVLEVLWCVCVCVCVYMCVGVGVGARVHVRVRM